MLGMKSVQSIIGMQLKHQSDIITHLTGKD